MSPNDLAMDLDGLDAEKIDLPEGEARPTLASESGAAAAGQCYCVCCACYCDNKSTMA